MSYQSLLVIGTPEHQLAEVLDPYLRLCKNRAHAQFIDEEDEYQAAFKTTKLSRVRLPNGTLRRVDELDDAALQSGTVVKVAAKLLYGSFQDFMRGECPSIETNDAGRYGRWENPNAKFEYYVVGGRIHGFFQLTDGGVGKLGESHSRFDPIPDPNTADVTELQYWDRARQREIEAARATARHRFVTKKCRKTPFPWSDGEYRNTQYPGSPVAGYDRVALEALLGETEADYVRNCSERADVAYSVLKDGVIHQRAHTGWPQSAEEQAEFSTWRETFHGLFEGLAPNTPVIAVTARS